MTCKGVIFDLDGTLINTLEDLTDSMNFALEKLGCPSRCPKECCRMIGNGLMKFAERALPANQKNLCDELVRIMVSHYQQHCLIKTSPYDGIVDVIEHLMTKKVRMAVLTNKNQKPTEAILEHFWEDGTFDPIVGICQGRKAKPDPESTLGILKQWQLPPSKVIFVGDSEIDVQTALAAGVTPIGCEWGFRDAEQIIAAGAEILIQKPIQILDYLD